MRPMPRLLPLLLLLPAPVLAAPFERPIPQGETGAAAVSYAVAAVALVLAFGAFVANTCGRCAGAVRACSINHFAAVEESHDLARATNFTTPGFCRARGQAGP